MDENEHYILIKSDSVLPYKNETVVKCQLASPLTLEGCWKAAVVQTSSFLYAGVKPETDTDYDDIVFNKHDAANINVLQDFTKYIIKSAFFAPLYVRSYFQAFLALDNLKKFNKPGCKLKKYSTTISPAEQKQFQVPIWAPEQTVRNLGETMEVYLFKSKITYEYGIKYTLKQILWRILDAACLEYENEFTDDIQGLEKENGGRRIQRDATAARFLNKTDYMPIERHLYDIISAFISSLFTVTAQYVANRSINAREQPLLVQANFMRPIMIEDKLVPILLLKNCMPFAQDSGVIKSPVYMPVMLSTIENITLKFTNFQNQWASFYDSMQNFYMLVHLVKC